MVIDEAWITSSVPFLRALTAVMVARGQSRDVSKQTVDASPMVISVAPASDVGREGGAVRHDTRPEPGMCPIHACHTVGVTSDERNGCRPITARRRCRATTISVSSCSSSGQNIRSERRRVTISPVTGRPLAELPGARLQLAGTVFVQTDRDGERRPSQ